MKTRFFFYFLLSPFTFLLVSAQIPQGFNYQAIARDGEGNAIANTTLQVELIVQADSLGKNIYWDEIHKPVTTNAFGLFTIILGKGARQATSTVASFSNINWSVTPVFLKTQIYYKESWEDMGSTKLWSVPYALTAKDIAGPVSKLAVTGATSNVDEALFEVKNRTGQTVFAVYSEGVRIYVDDGIAKGTKGGFAIGGFGTGKVPPQDFFVVSSDSIRAYIGTNPLKAKKGGFAIGGFSTNKAPNEEYMRVTRDSTRVYTNPNAKGLKGGFAIGSFNTGKGLVDNYLNLTPQNYFIGLGAGKSNTTGTFNSFMGYQSGFSNTTGSNNVFAGYQVGHNNTSGFRNTMVGYLAGFSNTIGNSNTFIGDQAGNANTSGSQNISIGPSAGLISNGDGNLFIGVQAGRYNTTGALNVFLGNGTGIANTTAFFNTFLGSQAGYSTTDGSLNVYVGMNAGGQNVHGSGNVFLGSSAGYSETNVSNRLYIENSSADKNTALIYGEFDTKNLTFNGKVGIGRTSPAARLDIAGGNWIVTGASEGDFRIGDANYRFKLGVATGGGGAGNVRMTAMGGTSRLILGGNGVDVLAIGNGNIYPWSDNAYTFGTSGNRWSAVYSAGGVITTSDERFKRNVKDLDYGLESIMKLKPVSYSLIDDRMNRKRLGLVAQDVEKVINEVVDIGNDPSQTLGINYSELVPVLIKGIQEQQQQINSSLKENTGLRTEIESLKQKMEQIEASLSKENKQDF